MSHTISQSQYKTTTPTGLYEANYRRLIRLVPQLGDMPVNESHLLPQSAISIIILEQHKYTSVISFIQMLQLLGGHNEEGRNKTQDQEKPFISLFKSINMELRVCHDACLVEVIGYQGASPIQSAIAYPNKHMLQIDEKRQLNLFLKDVLENSLKTEDHHKHTVL